MNDIIYVLEYYALGYQKYADGDLYLVNSYFTLWGNNLIFISDKINEEWSTLAERIQSSFRYPFKDE